MNRTHHRILSKIGANRVIQPEQEIGQHIAQMLHNPSVRDYLSLGNENYIVDFNVAEQLDGSAIADLELTDRHSIRCLGLIRDRDFIACDSGQVNLQTGDKLLLFGQRRNLRKFGDSI